jgi:hypothetical protein
MTNKPITLHTSRVFTALLLPLILMIFSCENKMIPEQPENAEVLQSNSKLSVAQQLLAETTQPGYPITNITYNADNSLKSFVTDGVYTTIVSYAPGKVVYTTLLGGKKSSAIVYEIANQLTTRKTETVYTSSGNVADFVVTDFYYKSGKLYKEAYRENDLPDGYLIYYNDGINVTFQERYDAEGGLVNKVSYDYYLKLVNKSKHLSQFNLRMDAMLFPSFSTNLIQSKTLKKAGKNPVVTQFTYLLNNEGYPVGGDVTGPFPYNWVSNWQ